jgi:hypothetical protein
MIDFENISKRVCSDARLRREFLQDPVTVTERLLQESYIALTGLSYQLHGDPSQSAVAPAS